MYERYLQQMRAIEGKALAYSPFSDVDAFRKFALFTTNLGFALPAVPLAEHLPLFRRAIANRQLCFLDEEYSWVVPWRWREGHALDVDQLKSQPAIIGTFHVGSYRLLNHLLVHSGVPVALLVSSTVRERQGADFLAKGRSAEGESLCTLITADHPMAGLHILRAVKNGRTVVGYLDGNRGAPAQQHVHKLPFLDMDIRARIGLAHLAQRGGVPLYGVMARRCPDGHVVLWKSRSFYADAFEKQCVSPEAATAMLYADLAEIIRVEPWQWDQWYYLHETFLDNGMG